MIHTLPYLLVLLYLHNTPRYEQHLEECVFVVINFSRLGINRVWLPILLVAS